MSAALEPCSTQRWKPRILAFVSSLCSKQKAGKLSSSCQQLPKTWARCPSACFLTWGPRDACRSPKEGPRARGPLIDAKRSQFMKAQENSVCRVSAGNKTLLLCLVTKSCPIISWPHGLYRLLCPCKFPGNTRHRVKKETFELKPEYLYSCPWTTFHGHFLLQGIFPTQGSNPLLLHWQVASLSLRHQRSP